MILKSYKEYIEYHPFWQNQGWKINYIRKFIDEIQNNKYKLKDKEKYDIINKLDDIEERILQEIDNWLDEMLLIKASIS